MKHIIVIVACLLFCGLPVYGQGIIPKVEIQPYIEFIEQPHLSAKDYIISLFDKHDIVILSEGHHGEIYQYDLIHDVISDRRFIDKVGNVFTEVGVANMTEEVNDFLHGSYLPSDADSLLSVLYRKMDFFPLWERYNFYLYLKRIYQLNQGLLEKEKINAYFTEIPFSWDTVTSAEQYERFEKNVWCVSKDSIIASNMIVGFEKVRETKRKKALVIYNRPHSFVNKFYSIEDSLEYKCAGWYIKKKYGDKVANVLLNSLSFSDNDGACPIADGKWDAAFYAKGFPNIGFKLEQSPFGEDTFDLYPDMLYGIYEQYNDSTVLYKDFFDSFVYYKSPKEQLHAWGVPNVMDSTFLDELIRRQYIRKPELLSHDKKDLIKSYSQYYGKLHILHVLDAENSVKYDKAINQWFEKM